MTKREKSKLKLERGGQNPLLFFLKCLDAEDVCLHEFIQYFDLTTGPFESRVEILSAT